MSINCNNIVIYVADKRLGFVRELDIVARINKPLKARVKTLNFETEESTEKEYIVLGIHDAIVPESPFEDKNGLHVHLGEIQ